jgi:hypothetical protein
LKQSLTGKNAGLVAKSHQFATELQVWVRILGNRREAYLVKVAALEYEFALLALTQGHYRHAFKGLRLVMELCLQAVFLSANELRLREWLDNRADTVWSAIVDPEDGAFSKRFARSFFPSLEPHVQHYRGLAESVYRECSECVHGNIPRNILLPGALRFDQGVFELWHSKAALIALVTHFALSLRYLSDVREGDLATVEPFLSDHVGHVAEIRARLGGPVSV